MGDELTSTDSIRRGEARHGRASDRVLTDLRRMILTFELAPGSVVTETHLAEVLKCSRTPLREALQSLSHEHLVVAVPRRGVSIADLSIVGFGEAVQAAESVGGPISRLAATRITDVQLSHLDDLLVSADEADAAGDLAKVVALDFQLHAAIAAASGNPLLLEFEEMLLRLLSRYTYLGFRRVGCAVETSVEHRRIVEALRSRDADRADAAVRDHMCNARERMRRAL